MKINPIKNYKAPDYPDLIHLSKLPNGKKLIAAIAAAATVASMSGCRTAGDVQLSGVAAPETEVRLTEKTDVISETDVALDGEIICTTDTIEVNYYLCTDGFTLDKTETITNGSVMDFFLSDSVLTVYSGYADVYENTTVAALTDCDEFRLKYADGKYKTFETTDGNVVVINLLVESDWAINDYEEVQLAGDVAIDSESAE